MKFNFFKKPPIIEFFCEPDLLEVLPRPIPAYKKIPDWFKKIPAESLERRDEWGKRSRTAKKCMPLLDAMSLGYILTLGGDVHFKTNKEGSLFFSGGGPLGNFIEFHDKDQLGGKTSPTYPGPAVKFVNRWTIKTAPGYSTLFVPPLNSMEDRFTCLSGVVETDNYPKTVNFPAVWHKKGFDDTIVAGTPLVMCIPFKRSEIPKDVICRAMTHEEERKINVIHDCQFSRAGYYENELREKK